MLVALLLVCVLIRAGCAGGLTAAGCKTCAPDDQTCTACTEASQNVQIDKKGCSADCPAHSTAKQNVCECDTGYEPASGQNQCNPVSNGGCAGGLTAAGCKTCAPDDQTCTACTEASQNVQIDKKGCSADCPAHSTAKQNVCECDTGYEPASGQNQCNPVSNGGCAGGLTAAGCKTCAPDDQTCTACTEASQNVQIDKKGCSADCPAHSTAKQNVCECDTGYEPASGQNQCNPVSNGGCAGGLTAAGCKTCAPDDQTCTACTEASQNVQIDKKGCSADCPAHSTAKQNVCECDTGYEPASGQNQCNPVSNGGCAGGLTAAGCKTCAPDDQTCTACTEASQNVQIDKKGCSADCPAHSTAKQNVCECDTGYEPASGQNQCNPVSNGGCAGGLTAAGCKTCAPDDQTCTACTEASQNVQIDKKGCSADCPAHSTAKQNVCECDTGYEPASGQNQCRKTPSAGCNTPSCKTCNNPETDNEVCTECNDGFVLGDGNKCVASSVNKSGGLSTGAIAGIAVAVVIVVGGLVGFLCWWFLCRGKA